LTFYVDYNADEPGIITCCLMDCRHAQCCRVYYIYIYKAVGRSQLKSSVEAVSISIHSPSLSTSW